MIPIFCIFDGHDVIKIDDLSFCICVNGNIYMYHFGQENGCTLDVDCT